MKEKEKEEGEKERGKKKGKKGKNKRLPKGSPKYYKSAFAVNSSNFPLKNLSRTFLKISSLLTM